MSNVCAVIKISTDRRGHFTSSDSDESASNWRQPPVNHQQVTLTRWRYHPRSTRDLGRSTVGQTYLWSINPRPVKKTNLITHSRLLKMRKIC